MPEFKLKTCKLCLGSGYCSNCDGDGLCPACHGLGCDRCEGLGDCPDCDGDGFCPKCDGIVDHEYWLISKRRFDDDQMGYELVRG